MNATQEEVAAPIQKKYQLINGLKMAYVETGQKPIVFLLGNPASVIYGETFCRML